MTIKNAGRSALRLPYLAVRTPLGLLDDQVVRRVFGESSTAYRSLTRGLHSLDMLAATAMGMGGTQTAPSRPDDAAPDDTAPDDTASDDTASDADDRSADAEDQPAPAPVSDAQEARTLPEPSELAAEERPPVEEQQIDDREQQEIIERAESYLAEEALAPQAGELADDDEIRRVQAEIRAKQEIETERGQL